MNLERFKNNLPDAKAVMKMTLRRPYVKLVIVKFLYNYSCHYFVLFRILVVSRLVLVADSRVVFCNLVIHILILPSSV